MIFFFTQLISHCYSFLDSDPDSEELEYSLDESHETDPSLLCPEILSDNSVDDDDSNNEDNNNGNNEGNKSYDPSKWSSETEYIEQEPELQNFMGERKLGEDIDHDSILFDVFKLFISQTFLREIKQQTNLYASQQIRDAKQENAVRRNSLFQLWKTLTLVNLKKFFAIVLHMSVLKKPQLRDYWSTNPVLHSSFGKSMMSRD